MIGHDMPQVGRFCWVDLAASDAKAAKAFYRRMFGWDYTEQPANGGSFTRARLFNRDVGSLYQLGRTHLQSGIPSHWTPYVRVDDIDGAARRAVSCGGRVLVRPFAVADVARIAVVLDTVGAQIGLWGPTEAGAEEDAHG